MTNHSRQNMPEVFQRKAHATQDPKMLHYRGYDTAYLHYILDRREHGNARYLGCRQIHYVGE